MKQPNYFMIRTVLKCLNNLSKEEDLEFIPQGYPYPKCDVKMIPTLAILNYMHHAKTQFSCQGNHKRYYSRAYVLLAPEQTFPKSLLERMKDVAVFEEVDDYDLKTHKKTDKNRFLLSAPKGMDSRIMQKNNCLFIRELNNWAMEEIVKCIPFFESHSLDNFFEIYKEELP